MSEKQTVSVALQLVYDPRSKRAFQEMTAEAAESAEKLQKEVQTRMNRALTAQGQANARQFARMNNIPFRERQDRLGDLGNTASRLGFGSAGNTIGQVGGFAGGLQAAGFGGAASLAQRAAVPLAIAATIANAVERVAALAHDKYSNNAQLGRAVVRDFIPGGERVQKFMDSVTGRAAGMEEADIQGRYKTAEGASRNELAQFQLQHGPRQAGLEATARAYAGSSAATARDVDRTAAGGELEYRREQRLLPLKQAEAKAERDMAAAAAERAEAQQELIKSTARVNDLTDRHRRAQEAANAGRGEVAPTPGRRTGGWVRPFGFLLGGGALKGATEDLGGSGVRQQERLREAEAAGAELGGALGVHRAAGEADVGARTRRHDRRNIRLGLGQSGTGKSSPPHPPSDGSRPVGRERRSGTVGRFAVGRHEPVRPGVRPTGGETRKTAGVTGRTPAGIHRGGARHDAGAAGGQARAFQVAIRPYVLRRGRADR